MSPIPSPSLSGFVGFGSPGSASWSLSRSGPLRTAYHTALNVVQHAGTSVAGGASVPVQAGEFLRSADEVAELLAERREKGPAKKAAKRPAKKSAKKTARKSTVKKAVKKSSATKATAKG